MKYIIHKENELKHYGVPGTKWGVRRYQNKDGSYKPGAEGRYYDAVKKGLSIGKNIMKGVGSVGTTAGSSNKGAKSSRVAVKRLTNAPGQTSKAGEKSREQNEQQSSGNSSSDRPINKTVLGKDINVKDVSEKLATKEEGDSKSKKKSTKSGSGTASSKEKTAEDFKVDQLADKIETFFDMDNMSDNDWEELDLLDSDISELNDLIAKYRQWRSGNKSNTKKLRKIDEFIERYEAWKSSRSKHSETRELYLMHFGTLGMKWGIRKYQNEDGTYTTLGKLRRKLKGEDRDADYNRAHGKEKVRYLSTEELEARNKRLNAENNYLRNRQQNEELHKSKVSKTTEEKTNKFIDKVIIGPLTDYAALEFKKHLPDIVNAGKEYYNSRRKYKHFF